MNSESTIFTFVGYTFKAELGEATFSYQLQTPEKTYDFTEKINFEPTSIADTKRELLNSILNNMLLMLGISYWKTYCPKQIKINGFSLTQDQANFWNTIYTNGLGEFYFRNSIDYRGLVKFPFDEQSTSIPEPSSLTQNTKSLVFFGGGKDSIVSAELLKQQNIPFDLFMVNSVDIQNEGANIVGTKTIAFKRTIDTNLLELNKQQGVYNGHIPVSAVWAFMGLLASVLYDYKFLITSNEHSANYGNVEYLGQEVNHQWSKSLEFETLFREYVAKNISKDIEYFSLLRPLYEVKITQIFTKNPQYFSHFSSCNKNFKITNPLTGTRWCGECPKCLFVFILLSAFLDRKTVIDIFGKNLFDDYSLLPLLRELLDLENFKPFECVGTPEETRLALLLISQKKDYQNDVLVSLFLQSFPDNNEETNILQERLLQSKMPACLPHEFTSMIDTL